MAKRRSIRSENCSGYCLELSELNLTVARLKSNLKKFKLVELVFKIFCSVSKQIHVLDVLSQHEILFMPPKV